MTIVRDKAERDPYLLLSQLSTVRSAYHLTAITIALMLFGGCASSSYRLGSGTRLFHARENDKSPQLPSNAEMQVTIGGHHPRLDKIEKVVHFPARKFKQWFGKQEVGIASEDDLREQAIAMSQEYLALNQLHDVKIDVSEYNPAEQWRRLNENKSIHPFWKYTTGTLQHAEYCLIPGRVMNRDSYNIFTNTLSINSVQPEQALYASATAKYLRSKSKPGVFSTACHLPFVPLYRDYHVANDVLSYARYREDWRTEKLLYPQIYGSFGGDLVSQATSLVPSFAYFPFYVKPVLTIGGRMGGTATGAVVLKQREKEVEAGKASKQADSQDERFNQANTPLTTFPATSVNR